MKYRIRIAVLVALAFLLMALDAGGAIRDNPIRSATPQEMTNIITGVIATDNFAALAGTAETARNNIGAAAETNAYIWSLNQSTVPLTVRMGPGSAGANAQEWYEGGNNLIGSVSMLGVFAPGWLGGFAGRDAGITNEFGLTIEEQILTLAGALSGAAITNNESRAVTLANDLSVRKPENFMRYDTNRLYLLFEGDSLTANENSYAYWLTNLLGWNGAFVTNAATGGDEIADLNTQWATEAATHAPGTGTNALFFVWIGANDHVYGDPATFIATYSNYLARVLASNFTPVVFTVLPRASALYGGDDELGRTNRFLINKAIRSWSDWAYIVDAESMFKNPYDTLDYSDQTHITTNAHYRLAQAVDGILRGPKHNTAPVGPTQSGTNFFWYTPDGAKLASLNLNGNALEVHGNADISGTAQIDDIGIKGSSTATGNTFAGAGSGDHATGGYNTAFGNSALDALTTGTDNAAFGHGSLYQLTTGIGNLSYGRNSMYSLLSGRYNLSLGPSAGYGDGTVGMRSTNDDYCIFIGFQASRDSSLLGTKLTNGIAIGKAAKVAANNQMVIGSQSAEALSVIINSNLTVNGYITNISLTPSRLIGTDANKAETSIDIGTGLSLDGGTLNATASGSATNAVVGIKTNGVSLVDSGATNLNFFADSGVTITGTNVDGAITIGISAPSLLTQTNYWEGSNNFAGPVYIADMEIATLTTTLYSWTNISGATSNMVLVLGTSTNATASYLNTNHFAGVPTPGLAVPIVQGTDTARITYTNLHPSAFTGADSTVLGVKTNGTVLVASGVTNLNFFADGNITVTGTNSDGAVTIGIASTASGTGSTNMTDVGNDVHVKAALILTNAADGSLLMTNAAGDTRITALTNGGAFFFSNVVAKAFSGDGSSLTGIGAVRGVKTNGVALAASGVTNIDFFADSNITITGTNTDGAVVIGISAAAASSVLGVKTNGTDLVVDGVTNINFFADSNITVTGTNADGAVTIGISGLGDMLAADYPVLTNLENFNADGGTFTNFAGIQVTNTAAAGHGVWTSQKTNLTVTGHITGHFIGTDTSNGLEIGTVSNGTNNWKFLNSGTEYAHLRFLSGTFDWDIYNPDSDLVWMGFMEHDYNGVTFLNDSIRFYREDLLYPTNTVVFSNCLVYVKGGEDAALVVGTNAALSIDKDGNLTTTGTISGDYKDLVADSLSVPMTAWWTNWLDSPASCVMVSNVASSFSFTHDATNAIRCTFAMPQSWNAGTVRLGLRTLCTADNANDYTNVVWSVSATALGDDDDVTSVSAGTAVWVTNRINGTAYKSREAITGNVTVGNTPTTGKTIRWDISQLGAAGGDTFTNTTGIKLMDVRIYYNKVLTNSLPTPSI